MELAMHPDARFWDKIADKYSKRPIADEAAYERKLSISKDYFRADMDVLEFGCGTGGTALHHAPNVASIHAIDVSPRMIEIAKNKQASAKAENVNFEVGSIETLDVPDQSYDAILAMSVLHLLQDKEMVINKVYRLLRPGGVFISSTACIGDGLKIFKYIEPIGRALGLMPAVKVFNAKQLIETLEASGFQIEYQWQPGKLKATFIVARTGRAT